MKRSCRRDEEGGEVSLLGDRHVTDAANLRKVAAHIFTRDARQCTVVDFQEVVAAPATMMLPPQIGLVLMKAVFDRVEVGGVRGRVNEPGTGTLDQFLDAGVLMDGRVVHDDDGTRFAQGRLAKGRDEIILNPHHKSIRIDGAIIGWDRRRHHSDSARQPRTRPGRTR